MRGITRRAAVLVSVVGLFLVGLFAQVAAGQSADDVRDQIVITGTLDVPSGETVDTAVILNGPATIEGTVRETLVVLNGRTEIAGTIGGDVVVVNGSVVIRSGAEVGGDVRSREDPTIEDGAVVRGAVRGIAARFDVKGLGLATRFAWWIAYSVSTLVLGGLLLAFAPALDGALAGAARNRMGAGFGVGAALFFLVPIGAVVLLVTIVGIPLGVFVLLGLALLYTVGYVAGAHGIGRLLVKPPSSRFAAYLAGWAILRGIGLIPVAGGLAWLLASILGLGLLAVSSRRRPAVPGPALIPPPPAPA